MRKCLALAFVLAACGTGEDERPATLEVVTLTVLAPNCGQVQCHSSSTWREGYAFDTVEAARASLKEISLPGNTPIENMLMDVLLGQFDEPRMPPDTPLATEDIQLIERWMREGRPGL